MVPFEPKEVYHPISVDVNYTHGYGRRSAWMHLLRMYPCICRFTIQYIITYIILRAKRIVYVSGSGWVVVCGHWCTKTALLQHFRRAKMDNNDENVRFSYNQQNNRVCAIPNRKHKDQKYETNRMNMCGLNLNQFPEDDFSIEYIMDG